MSTNAGSIIRRLPSPDLLLSSEDYLPNISKALECSDVKVSLWGTRSIEINGFSDLCVSYAVT